MPTFDTFPENTDPASDGTDPLPTADPDPQVPGAWAPIGVFDSGVGGLSILRAVHRALPDEDLLYVADSANAPYGDRDACFIAQRSEAMVGFLADSGAKAVVVACNTATVVAVERLRDRFKLPIRIIESSIAVAQELTRRLGAGRVARSAHRHGLVRLHSTGHTATARGIMSRLWGASVEVRQVPECHRVF